MSATRVSHIRAEDLLDEDVPTGRAPRPRVGRRRQAAGFALGLIVLPLLTLLLTEMGDALSLEGEVLLYLAAVVLVSVVGGIPVALLAAVSAALLINYYLVPPLHTLNVAEGEQALSLGVFVVVAVVVSGAVELARQRARAAEAAIAQAETLSTLAGPDLDERETLRAVLERARQTFSMESVSLKRRDGATGAWEELERAGWSPEDGAP
jgi:two-component system sensor histidine kinase KdpD